MFKKLFLILAIAATMWQPAAAQAQDGEIVWTKYTHNIARLQFSNDDSKILTVGSGGIIIFDTQTGEQIKQLPGNGSYSEDGSIIYSSHLNDIDHYIEIFDAVTYESLRRLELPEIVGKYGVTLSPDKKTFVAGGYNDLYFIEYETGIIKKHLTKFGNETRPVSLGAYPFTKDGRHIVVNLADPVKGEYGKLMFINVNTYQADYTNDLGWKGGIALSDDGNLIAFGTSELNKAVTIMNTQTKEIVGQIPGNATAVTSIAFSPDGQYITFSDLNYNTKIYKLSSFNVYKNISMQGEYFNSMDITLNNQFLIGSAGPVLLLMEFQANSVAENPETELILYPNPANNSVNLSFELTIPTNLEFNLYNFTGGLITNLKTDFYNPGVVEENLYLGELANGTYYLKIESLQFHKTNKIIINR